MYKTYVNLSNFLHFVTLYTEFSQPFYHSFMKYYPAILQLAFIFMFLFFTTVIKPTAESLQTVTLHFTLLQIMNSLNSTSPISNPLQLVSDHSLLRQLGSFWKKF